MKYLLPIVKKISQDDDFIENSRHMTDEIMYQTLLLEVSLNEIKEAFYKHYGFKYQDIKRENINTELLEYFELDFLKKELVVPYHFEERTKTWNFAIYNIADNKLKTRIKKMLEKQGNKALFVFSFKHEIEEFYNEESKVEKIQKIDVSNDAIEWVKAVINNGISVRASDIHIEPRKEGIQVRYRVDGVMTGRQMFVMDSKEISNIYVRLKVVGNMDISEKRKSQDGRIDNYQHPLGTYSMRVSTLNTVHGEKVVLRLLSESDESSNFSDLGFEKEEENKVKRMLKKSNGIVYLAGATGSGKTTTLYAMIDELDKDELNIYTIENPVEKTIDGVNQVQVDEASRNTYPSVLKTLLRQDPDIMVIGEIRESETAKLAVQASLTGHLVITTIHANNALESISRLSEMGVESFLIGASSVGFLSQRLVRILCEHCKEKVETLTEYENIWMKNSLNENFNYEEEKAKGNYIYKKCGCEQCVNGYKGRVAVLEIIEVDEKIKELISLKAGTKEIKEYLETNGYRDMKYDGALKAIKGITSIEELMGKLQN